MHSLGKPVWTPRDYGNLADEGYEKNVIAYRSVTEVARGIASVPWQLFSQGRDKREQITDESHPLLKLLRRPNPLMGAGEFMEAAASFLLIAGNSYLERVPDNGNPTELYPLRPDRMKVVAGETGLPSAFEMKVRGATTRWDANVVTGDSAILHLKTFHPRNDWYGLSPLEAAARSVDQRNTADDWNVALMQNSARPSGALTYEPKEGPPNLSDTQYTRLKEQLDGAYTGSKAGRPMLLDGGLSWQQMSFSPTDMDWLNAKNTSSRDIALAFGVPPLLIGIPGDNTFANYKEARLALWEETIIPWLRHIRDEFNYWLAPLFGEGLMLDFDLNEIPALSVRRESVWTNAQSATFLTINEKAPAGGHGRCRRRRCDHGAVNAIAAGLHAGQGRSRRRR